MFGRVWKQYLTVPLLLVVVLFPLINFKSPTFFTKLNALGMFSALFMYATPLRQFDPVISCISFDVKNHISHFTVLPLPK